MMLLVQNFVLDLPERSLREVWRVGTWRAKPLQDGFAGCAQFFFQEFLDDVYGNR
jgi:hypothetical protein